MPVRQRFSRFGARSDAAPGGVWSPGPDGASLVERLEEGPTVLLVPTEQVLLLTVDLPLPRRAQRLAALPFAIEDRIADRLEDVHVALGGATGGPQRYLAGVVRHTAMRGWIAAIGALDLAGCMIVPEVLVLPAPPPGGWSIAGDAMRVLVRTDTGEGFAVPVDRLAAVREGGGQPMLIDHGVSADFPLPTVAPGQPAASLAARIAAVPLDLRQGMYSPPRQAMPAIWRRAAWVVAGGALAHGAIAAADTVALADIARDRRAETRALIERAAPGITVGDDVVAAATALLPAEGDAVPGRFLPLLGSVARALGPVRSQVTIQALAYDEAQATLSLQIETSDMAALQSAEAALAAAGLAPQNAGVTSGAGRTEGKFTVRAR